MYSCDRAVVLIEFEQREYIMIDDASFEFVFSLLAFALKAASIVECLRRRRRRTRLLDNFTLPFLPETTKKNAHNTRDVSSIYHGPS